MEGLTSPRTPRRSSDIMQSALEHRGLEGSASRCRDPDRHRHLAPGWTEDLTRATHRTQGRGVGRSPGSGDTECLIESATANAPPGANQRSNNRRQSRSDRCGAQNATVARGTRICRRRRTRWRASRSATVVGVHTGRRGTTSSNPWASPSSPALKLDPAHKMLDRNTQQGDSSARTDRGAGHPDGGSAGDAL